MALVDSINSSVVILGIKEYHDRKRVACLATVVRLQHRFKTSDMSKIEMLDPRLESGVWLSDGLHTDASLNTSAIPHRLFEKDLFRHSL